MKKQISFPKLVPRIFSTTLDLLLLSGITPLVMNFIGPLIYAITFKDFLAHNNINWWSLNTQIFHTQDFLTYIRDNNQMLRFLLGISVLSLINFSLMGIYFVSCWHYKGMTLGKLIMRMKIVDEETLRPPSLYKSIKRFLLFPTGVIGVWSITFTTKSQSLHDKLAGTIVIKV